MENDIEQLRAAYKKLVNFVTETVYDAVGFGDAIVELIDAGYFKLDDVEWIFKDGFAPDEWDEWYQDFLSYMKPNASN